MTDASDAGSKANTPSETSSPPSPSAGARRHGRMGLALPFFVAVVVTFLVAWFLFATVTGFPVGLGPLPQSSNGGIVASSVVMTINNPFDTENNSTGDQYAPANFTVPSHTLLEITMINYDGGQNPVTSAEATVSGTVGNCVYENVSTTSLGPCLTSLNAGYISHTFSFVSGPYAGFNVPIPSSAASAPGGIGGSVTFFAYFNVTGTFVWNCLAPCDAWSMLTSGFMTGSMTVT